MKTIHFIFMFVLLSYLSEAQSYIGAAGAKTDDDKNFAALLPDASAYKRPISFEYVRPDDKMWSKIVWRKIEVREKINQKFYYPQKHMGNYFNLMEALIVGVETENISAFTDEDFTGEIGISDIKLKFGATDSHIDVTDENGNFIKTVSVHGEMNFGEVTHFLMKEEWFFDKHRSLLDVRIIAICPVREYYRAEDVEMENPQYKKLFWISYEQSRDWLAHFRVFNTQNDVTALTWDDVLVKRFFHGTIVQETNQYNNRAIAEYAQGIEQMWEDQRIKEKIFDMEQNVWQY